MLRCTTFVLICGCCVTYTQRTTRGLRTVEFVERVSQDANDKKCLEVSQTNSENNILDIDGFPSMLTRQQQHQFTLDLPYGESYYVISYWFRPIRDGVCPVFFCPYNCFTINRGANVSCKKKILALLLFLVCSRRCHMHISVNMTPIVSGCVLPLSRSYQWTAVRDNA